MFKAKPLLRCPKILFFLLLLLLLLVVVLLFLNAVSATLLGAIFNPFPVIMIQYKRMTSKYLYDLQEWEIKEPNRLRMSEQTHFHFKYRNDLLKPNMDTTWKTLDIFPLFYRQFCENINNIVIYEDAFFQSKHQTMVIQSILVIANINTSIQQLLDLNWV